MKQELVKYWMTANPITVTLTTSLPEAHRLMKERNVRRLPVVNKRGKLLGIITLGDIRGAQASPATSLSIWELNYLIDRLQVKDFMTKSPLTVTADATVISAAQIMLSHKVSGLPVMDGSELVGIITESDIFEMLILHNRVAPNAERVALAS